jgi:hypothetical protein
MIISTALEAAWCAYFIEEISSTIKNPMPSPTPPFKGFLLRLTVSERYRSLPHRMKTLKAYSGTKKGTFILD